MVHPFNNLIDQTFFHPNCVLFLFLRFLLTYTCKLSSVIVRISALLKRTVVVDNDWRFDNLSGNRLHSYENVCSRLDNYFI